MSFHTRHWLALAVVVVALDQVTKHWASAVLDYGAPLAIVPGLNFTLLHNTGAAFSFLSNADGWQRWFFTGVALIVSGVIAVWLTRVDPRERALPLALSLILGGAIGNVWDRLYLGYVVDFIQVYYKSFTWPAFNIADSAICVGAAILLLSGWVQRPASAPET